MDIKPIRRRLDYEKALGRIEELWEARKGSPEGDELEILTTLIQAYEDKHYPIDLPDPIEAIKFRIEQLGRDTKALIGIIGRRERVYEVLQRRRPLSLNMIRSLHRNLQIPAEVLIQIPSVRRTPSKTRGMRTASRKLRKSA